MLSKPANTNCKVFNLIRPWFKGKASTLTIRFKGKASTLTIRFKGKASTLTIRLEGKASTLTITPSMQFLIVLLYECKCY